MRLCAARISGSSHGISVEYQRTDQACGRQKLHRREAARRGERADDRALLDRGVAVRHRAEIRRQRRAGEISFRQQGRAVAGAAGARRRDRDVAARISAQPADLADRETAPAYRRHHPRLSPVPLYEPADPLSAAREQRGSRRRSVEVLRRTAAGVPSPAAGRRHQGRRVPQHRSGAVLHQPDRRLRSPVLRPPRDVARDRRRSGHRRGLPRIYQAHGSADLRRHAESKRTGVPQPPDDGRVAPSIRKSREETPKER